MGGFRTTAWCNTSQLRSLHASTPTVYERGLTDRRGLGGEAVEPPVPQPIITDMVADTWVLKSHMLHPECNFKRCDYFRLTPLHNITTFLALHWDIVDNIRQGPW